MEPSLSYLVFGGCDRNDNYNRLEQHKCVLEPADCGRSESTYVTPDKVTVFDHTSCDSVANVRIGRCSDSGLCGKEKESCQDETQFLSVKARDRRCSVRLDELTGKATLYTACKDKVASNNNNSNELCVVSSNECETNSQVSVYHDDSCDCSTTRTGACFLQSPSTDSDYSDSDDKTENYYCALSSGVCGEGMIFRTAHELYVEGDYDCRLCEADDVAFLANESDASTKSTDNTVPAAQIAIVTIAFVLGAGFIIVGIIFLRRRARRSPKTESTPKVGEGVDEISVGSIPSIQ